MGSSWILRIAVYKVYAPHGTHEPQLLGTSRREL